MALSLAALMTVVLYPKSTFKAIKDRTSMLDGIILYIILTSLSFIITIILPMRTLSGVSSELIIGFFLGLIIGSIILIIMAFLAAKIATLLSKKGSYNLGKTVGFIGYGHAVSVVMSAIFILILSFAVSSTSISSPRTFIPNMTIVLGLIGFIWSVYVNGSGVSIANEVGLGVGIISYLIVAIIMILVLLGILAAILSIGISTWTATTMFF